MQSNPDTYVIAHLFAVKDPDIHFWPIECWLIIQIPIVVRCAKAEANFTFIYPDRLGNAFAEK